MSSRKHENSAQATKNMILQANKGKSEAAEFRAYDDALQQQHVLNHYRDMRTYQTVDFYRRMEAKYSFDDGKYRALMTIEEAFDKLEDYVVRATTHQERRQ